MVSEDEVKGALSMVVDPEVGLNIVEMGLIYEIKISEGKVHVRMSLTSPGCPFGPQIIANSKSEILNLDGVKDAEIEIVFEPVWTPKMMSQNAKDKIGFDDETGEFEPTI